MLGNSVGLTGALNTGRPTELLAVAVQTEVERRY